MSKVFFYKVHDLNVKIDVSATKVPWKFNKLEYFQVDEKEIDCIDLEIVLGNFSIDTSSYLNMDHIYYMKNNEIYFSGKWNNFKWRSHWKGIEEGPMKAKIDIPAASIRAFPWLYMADWIIYWLIFRPLAEVYWARKNQYVIHAAAASKDKKAVVFTGYGSGLKTSFAMNLVRQGWKFLGDDQLLLTEEGIKCIPNSLQTFDFRVHHLDTEYLTFPRLFRLGIHLLKATKPRVAVEDNAQLAAWNLCIRTTHNSASRKNISAEEAAQQTWHNCYNESISDFAGNPGTSAPLSAYKTVFPEYQIQKPWDNLKVLLKEHLTQIPVNRIEMTEVWDDSFMELVELGNV